MSSDRRPLFSVVCATADESEAPFLGDLLESVAAQTFPADRVEVVRTGLADATGSWVVVPDPHDTLAPGFLANVAAWLDAHPDADLVLARPWVHDLASGERRDRLPARWMYQGDRLVDLLADGQRFPAQPTGAVLPLDALRAQGLDFDDRARPGFAHGHLVASYLLGLERPLVGFLADPGYRQRQLSPALARTWRSDVRRYGDVLEHGLLDLLLRAGDPAPQWLQALAVAELAAYVGFTDSQAPTGVPIDGPVADRFHDLVGQILDRIDRDAAVPHTAIWVREPGRTVLQHGWRDAAQETGWHEGAVRLGPFDEERGLVRASWWFTGQAPAEDLRLDGAPLVPTHAKTRDLDYCGRALLHERILWLPTDGAVTLRLDGKPVPFAHHAAETTTFATWPGIVAREVETLLPRLTTADPEPVPTSRDARKALKLVQSDKVRRRYRDAWVLMDRIYNTGDSAEVLFRHIRAQHPEINAWFVLEEDGPEWERFRREGDGDRLVAHGSLQWRLLMAHAQHLISSHVDEPIVHPPLVEELSPPRWRYHFLNHGLIKDDLSAWLNDKPIATFVTSSAQEYASIAGDHTPYTFTTHEVVDTGMPRFDRLLEIGRRYPADKRDLVLVAPTWRSGLSSLPVGGASRRELKDGVLETDYTRSWLAFLADPTLAEACREHGVTLAYLPHPNMQPMLPLLDLPEHVTPLEYEGYDVQEFFARSRVMVTDFSSVAFNAAYLERPLVYFQFDEDVVLGGGHMGRRGYFDYRRDGFGPVETTAGDAVAAVVTALEHGAAPAPAYQARIEATFPVRDGNCCERVIAAVRRTTEQERSAVPTPVMPAPVGVTA